MAQAAIPVRGTSQLHLGWIGLTLIVVAVALIAGAVGYVVGGNRATTANPDQTLANQSTAAWSGAYDAAKLAAVYAPDAVFVDTIEGETSTGLPAIQAKANNYLTNYQFVTKAASDPIRNGDSIAMFVTYGTNNAATNHALSVMQLKDGMIVRQTVYAMP
jgi:hypothetical protein